MKKKIYYSLFFFVICFFAFLSSPKATSFYYSMNLTRYTDLRSSSRATIEANFMNIDIWENFYNDMVSRINNSNNTVFADFSDITVITNMGYSSYYNVYFLNRLVFCPTDSISIVSGNIPSLYCNSDSVMMINVGGDYQGASVQGGSPRAAGALNEYAFLAGQPVLGMYTNNSSINSNGNYVSYLYSNSIPMYLIPSKVAYTYDFYLDDVLVDTLGCSYDDLSVTDSGGISCIVHPENITANKIVARTFLGQSYLPGEWSYNNLNFSDVSNRYYNAIIGGFFPDNTLLTGMSFINLSDSSVNYSTNLLDVQYTSLYRPQVDFRYNAFVVAFNFPDTITSLINYDSMEYTITFPTTNFSYFQMWENGFNNLSSNYIQENINLASNELQQEILNNLTGNSVPVDNFFSDFFTDFDVNYHGLSSLITLPLTYLSNLSSSCSAITLPLPFLNSNIVLPCFSTYYTNFLGSLYDIIQFLIRGFIYYFIVLDAFNFVKKLHSPNNTSVEVIDL